MTKYIIKSNYKYEIEAEDKAHAIEKWHENIEGELGVMNTTPAIEFAESLKVEEKIDINDAQHPLRQKAIDILEAIAEKLGDEEIFDCKKGNSKWYDFEDMIVEILNKK